MTRLVIAGGGMVGLRFAEDLLRADAAHRYEVTVLAAESHQPYNRVLLSEIVAGRYDTEAITSALPRQDRLSVLAGVRAMSIDRDDRAVIGLDASGAPSRHRYDQLVLATGAQAFVPPIAGLRDADGGLISGAFALRTLDDAHGIVAATGSAQRACVLGGGVLGLEVACGLARRGVPVDIVHPAGALMDRQLDSGASQVVEVGLESLGVTRHLGHTAAGVRATNGQVSAVELSDGTILPTDLLVLTTGTAPDIALAQQAELATQRGILVDERLGTDDPRIFAIGDCAQPPEGSTGLVAQGWDQARMLVARLTAASNAQEAPEGTYQPQIPLPVVSSAPTDVVKVKAHGLEVVTMGVTDRQAAGTRVVTLSDPAAGRHVEVAVATDAQGQATLAGATCVGSPEVAADLVISYTQRTLLPSDPAQMLLPLLAGAASAPVNVLEMAEESVVCRCNTVTKGALCAAIDEGACDVSALSEATRATTGCGGCTQDICTLLEARAPISTS